MKAVAILTLLVVNIRLSRSCYGEATVLVCQQIQGFLPGFSSLVLAVTDVGDINSTVLGSADLASITRLGIVNAGITGVAEGAFASMANLSSLNLERNLLTEISPTWFSRAATLNQLKLTGNRIQVLNESMLDGFSGLSMLHLNKNRIRTIDPGCFSSQTNLAELDLSENRLTRFLPQVFESLRSTRISLHGNPWDCSCDAQDFVVFLKDLQSRSLLAEETRVTCDSPPSLRGQPVWNVTVCVMSPSPGTASPTQTVHPETTDTSRPHPRSTATLASKPPSPSLPQTTSLSDVPAATRTYVTSSVTSPPSDTETSTLHKSSDLPPTDAAAPTITETHVTFPPRPLTGPNIVLSLTVVIVLLCVLLCVLALLHRRKRSSKAVMPRSQKEEKVEVKGDGRSGPGSSGLPETSDVTGNKWWDSEVGERRKHFTGVRAKSANALLLTSPFYVSNQVTLQTETEASSKDKENPSEGKKTPRDESEEAENVTDPDERKKTEKRDPGEDDRRVSVNMESVPYLSIGTNQNKPSPEEFSKQSADTQGQRSQTGKRMVRICTWPPTAVQWQGRCNVKEEEEERAVEWLRFKGEGSKVENPTDKQEVRAEQKEEVTDLTQDPVLSESLKMPEFETPHVTDSCSCFNEAHNQTDVRLEEQLEGDQVQGSVTELQKQNLERLKPAGNVDQKIISKSSSSSSKQLRNESKTRENRHTAENGRGNESMFMDLLQEVVQNNGRWTRETWRQANKQRHNLQGQ